MSSSCLDIKFKWLVRTKAWCTQGILDRTNGCRQITKCLIIPWLWGERAGMHQHQKTSEDFPLQCFICSRARLMHVQTWWYHKMARNWSSNYIKTNIDSPYEFLFRMSRSQFLDNGQQTKSCGRSGSLFLDDSPRIYYSHKLSSKNLISTPWERDKGHSLVQQYTSLCEYKY